MKKYSLVILVLFFFTEMTIAQNPIAVKEAIDLFRTSKMVQGDFNKTLTGSDIEGSPFLNDEFIDGTVYTKSNTKYVDVPLRYNIYNDNIEFDTEQGAQALSQPEIVDKVEFGDYLIVYAPYSISKKINQGFFILDEEGKASLLIKPEVAFIDAKEPAPYKEAEPAKFEKKADKYFIRVGKTEAKFISSKNDVIEAFPDNQDKIKAFIKKNKIKQRDVEDLKQVVQYYNSL